MTEIIDLGAIRASNRHVIQLRSYDPYPATGPKLYSMGANSMWEPLKKYNKGDWVAYVTGEFFYNGLWNASINFPNLSDSFPSAANTIYLVSKQGIQNFGNGDISFQIGDLVKHNGVKWTRVSADLITYVCTETHESSLAFEADKWVKNILPPYYILDNNNGVLYADIPYLPIYSQLYTFIIKIEKTDSLRNQTAFINQTFKLLIKGQIDDQIIFQSSTDLGSINQGYLSELFVKASHQSSNLNVKYQIISGQLPPGLTLGSDGSIIGRVDYDADIGQYNFKIRASDIYNQIVEKNFSIGVTKYDDLKYTQIYTKPFLLRNSRYNYSIFITDPSIFPRSMIYRPDDPNFGIQTEIKLFLEYGIQQVKLDDYLEAMAQGFYKKKLWFGEVKSSPGKDEQGNYAYDIVYIEIVDPLNNSQNEFIENLDQQIEVYPNSISEMRRSLELIEIDGEIVKLDEFQLPRWMRTPQPDSGISLGYQLASTLCFALPGHGDTIVDKIKNSEFKFNTIDFEIDRLIVENNLSLSGPKYLIFPSTSNPEVKITDLSGTIITSFVLGSSGILTTAGGQPFST
jgi:hypothetical protein